MVATTAAASVLEIRDGAALAASVGGGCSTGSITAADGGGATGSAAAEPAGGNGGGGGRFPPPHPAAAATAVASAADDDGGFQLGLGLGTVADLSMGLSLSEPCALFSADCDGALFSVALDDGPAGSYPARPCYSSSDVTADGWGPPGAEDLDIIGTALRAGGGDGGRSDSGGGGGRHILHHQSHHPPPPPPLPSPPLTSSSPPSCGVGRQELTAATGAPARRAGDVAVLRWLATMATSAT